MQFLKYLLAGTLIVCLPAQAMQQIQEVKVQHAMQFSEISIEALRKRLSDPVYFKEYMFKMNRALGGMKSWAERKKNILIVLQAGVNLNRITYAWGTESASPLSEAVLHDDMEFVALLLSQYGADLHNSTKQKHSIDRALLFSAKGKEIFKLLLQHGADVNAHDEVRGSVLCHIIFTDELSAECIQLCQEYNINLDKIHCDCSPFHGLILHAMNFDICIAKAKALVVLGVSLDDKSKVPAYNGLTFVEAIKVKIKERQVSLTRNLSDELSRKYSKDMLADAEKLLQVVQQAAGERRLVIKTGLTEFMPSGVAGIVLSYYEKEDFAQTEEEISQLYKNEQEREAEKNRRQRRGPYFQMALPSGAVLLEEF